MSNQLFGDNAHSHFFAIVRPDGHSNAGLDIGTHCENTPKQAFFLVLNVLVQNSCLLWDRTITSILLMPNFSVENVFSWELYCFWDR